MKKYILPLLLCISLSFSACRRSADIKDFSPAKVHRYEKFLMEADTARLQSELENALPEFSLFLEGADLSFPANLLRIRYFIEDPVVRTVYAKIEKTYTDGVLERDLGKLFARTSLLFPDFRAPETYTYISYYDFPNRILYTDTALFIALDLYVDNNGKALDETGIPRYLSHRINTYALKPDVARVIAASYASGFEKNDFLDHIVADGKILMFMRKVAPEVPTAALLGYTEEEYLWCRAHEKEIWQYAVQERLLYETDPMKFRYFVSEGPGNPLLSTGAPSRLSQYIGMRIAERYLKKTDCDWQTFWQTSSRDMLRQSGYKP